MRNFLFLLFFTFHAFFCLSLFAEDSAQLLYSKGYIEHVQANYEKAAEYYKASYELYAAEENYILVLYTCNSLGEVYFQLKKYDESISAYNICIKYLDLLDENLRPAFSETFYKALQGNYIAITKNFLTRGRYDEAIDYFKKLETYYTSVSYTPGLAILYNLRSVVYFEWARYVEAVKYAKKSYALTLKSGNTILQASNLHNIGTVYSTLGEYKTALDYYEQAVELYEKNGNAGDSAATLNNMGYIYFFQGNEKKALEYCNKALKIGRDSKNQTIIADSLGYLGYIYMEMGRLEAIHFHLEALEINRILERKSTLAHNLHVIGLYYYGWSEFSEAIEYFNESVALKEELRKTASGPTRRDYLAREIDTYQYLISSYVKKKDYLSALKIKELVSSKYLKEQLQMGSSGQNSFSIKQIQENLDEDTILINYANLNFEKIVVFAITRQEIVSYEVPVYDGLEKLFTELGPEIENYGGNKTAFTPGDVESLYKSYYFTRIDRVITYFRELLTDPDILARGLAKTNPGESGGTAGETIHISSKKNSADYGFELTGKVLYKLLISAVEKKLEGKKNIVIIPDGLLAYLPFETLIDSTNSYLVEKYNISYSHSLQVMDYLAKKKKSSFKKDILAFGGAVYNKTDYEADMQDVLENVQIERDNLLSSLDRGAEAVDLYKMMGMGTWSNLPGTLVEVQGIKKILPAGDFITGSGVNEQTIKKMAADKKLGDYRILHFSTHGIIFPELPELSAVVLSQPGQGGEDGYLTMGEIAALKIKTDCVILSACETGLGKLYRGEGVVGLIQAFLIAGARRISVSLWQVADESTSSFMVGYYGFLKKNGYDYGAAVSEMKRKFILDKNFEDFRSPYFWAPFVMYGK